MGGMHPIYVFSYAHKDKNNYIPGINYPYYDPAVANDNAGNVLYQDYQMIESGDVPTKKKVYSSMSWIAYPIIAPSHDLLSTQATV